MLNTEKFIEKARKKHGDKYDYSKVEYINSKVRVCIICREHGEFWQTPNTHLQGCGCPECAKKTRKEKQIWDTNEFLEKAIKVHGNKYDYSKVKYNGANKKVCIICPIHGEFWQKPSSHINSKQGCPKCYGNTKKTTIGFVEEARKIHGNKYDYSKVEYVNNHTKVCIICPKHGEFWQTPKEHLKGNGGCIKCSIISMKEKQKLGNDEFIKRANEIHYGKYDYSKVEYVNYEIPVCIICPKHGEFWQTPHSHLNGIECPYCANEVFVKEERLYNIILRNVQDEVVRYKKFKWLKYKNPMSIDIYIPTKKIGIEYQGKQHFKTVNFFGDNKEQLKRDKEKIRLCEKNGIKLFHFTFNKKDCEDWNEYKVYTDINDLIEEINGSNN